MQRVPFIEMTVGGAVYDDVSLQNNYREVHYIKETGHIGYYEKN